MLCKTCNKEHDGTYGSGKYCCRACSNSRVRTEETKQKISDAVKQGIESGRIPTGCSKGVKHKKIRSKEHADKIAKGIKQRWDEKGRRTLEQKRAGIKAAVYAYRARKKNAIPADADLDLIKKIYESAPTGYQIDHIIPLSKGGLHHQDNLQYLPSKDNQSKNNRLDYDSKNAIRWQDRI
jgi:5-methylcytosine-specific restriction endonuclease McrA